MNSLVKEAESQFQGAVEHAGLVNRHFTIAGRSVCLRFAGKTLADTLMPYFAHLAGAPVWPQWTISIWEDPDFKTAHTWLGPLEMRESCLYRAWNSGIAMARPRFGEYSIVDCASKQAHIGFWRDTAFEWKNVTPFRAQLNAAFHREGTHLFHAAAIGDQRQGVLIAGRGGVGKSTTALHCLGDRRLFYLGDDLCLVDLQTEPISIHSTYNTIKLLPAEVGRFPHLDFHLTGTRFDIDKPTAYLFPRMKDRLCASRSLRAILLPRIGGGAIRFTPARAADAFQALVVHTLAMVPGSWRTTTQAAGVLARRIPAFWLDLGNDRARIAPAIAEFLGGSISSVAA